MTSLYGGRVRSGSLDAWRRSHLAELPDEARTEMLADAFVMTVPAGNPIGEPGGGAVLALIHSGLTRIVLEAPDGRMATIRYAGPGQVLGLCSAIAGSSPWGGYAIAECEVTVLDPGRMRRLAQADPRVGWALARQVARICYEVVDALGGNVFGTIEQRVSRHLLDMAVRRPEGLVVLADQREIAHSVGSVREVVARPIRSLRERGALSRLPGGRGLLIKRPEVLSGIADGIDNGSCCTSPGSRRNHKGDPAPANKAPADKAPANKSHRKVSLAAWEASPLAGLPDGVRDALLDGSVVVRVPAGQPIGEAYGGPTFALVHFGHVRVQWATPEGRTATIRYAGAGQVLGLPSAVAGTTPWNGYAVTECEMTMMSGARLRHIAEKDGAVSWYLARQLVDISYDSIGVLGGNIFEPVLQRVARHLLTLAERTGGGLVVTADQDELAHSIGSVREVIARALRTLREQGVIARSAAGLMLVDPARLQEIAAGRRPDAAGESRPQRS